MKKNNYIAAIVIFCSSLLAQGCETTSGAQGNIVREKMITGLNGCLNKLTKDALIMKASTPSERVSTADGGEIWIYKYQKSEVTTTAEGTGSILMPVVAESKTQDYSCSIRLRFNKEGILVDWSFDGYIQKFNHPFADLQCQ